MHYFLFVVFFMLLNKIVDGTVEEEWEKFKLDYKKSYNSANDEEIHFNQFKENLVEISLHNKLFELGKVSYEKGITKFADLTDKEFVEIYRFDKRPTKIYDEEPDYENQQTNSSDYFDWREKGAVTKVKNQDTCGACWIYASVGALEGLYFKKHNKSIVLSEQSIVDCISNHSCKGGWPGVVFEYIYLGNGINKDEDYPPSSDQGKCNLQKSKSVHIDLVTAGYVGNSEEALKKALVENGPIVLCIYASEKWKLYKRGVWYEKECSDVPNHAVLLVGYGSENGHDYWLVKNSHSEMWGEQGYMKIARNKHHNYCSITKYAIYVK